MILDKLTLMSDDQSLAQAAGTTYSDILDTMGDAGYTTSKDAPSGVSKDIGEGTPKPLMCMVTQTFVGATATMVVTLQSSTDEAFTSPVNEIISKTWTVAELVAGTHLLPQHLPWNINRYLRIRYVTAVATTTAGKVTAGVGAALQS